MTHTEKPRALIVEDDPAISRLFSRILSDDFAVDTAADGIYALAHLAKKEYDVILLDLMMPNMNGDQLLAEMRKDYPRMPSRTLVATAVQGSVVGEYNLEGICHIVPKPVDIHELLTKARQCAGLPEVTRRYLRV